MRLREASRVGKIQPRRTLRENVQQGEDVRARDLIRTSRNNPSLVEKVLLVVIPSPSPVFPSEALHRMVQGEVRSRDSGGVHRTPETEARNLLFTKAQENSRFLVAFGSSE